MRLVKVCLTLAWLGAVCVQCWGERGGDGRFVEIETVFIDVLFHQPAICSLLIPLHHQCYWSNTINGPDRSNYHLRWYKNLNHKWAFPSFVVLNLSSRNLPCIQLALKPPRQCLCYPLLIEVEQKTILMQETDALTSLTPTPRCPYQTKVGKFNSAFGLHLNIVWIRTDQQTRIAQKKYVIDLKWSFLQKTRLRFSYWFQNL